MSISLDERCIYASVCDLNHRIVCQVINVYAPAQPTERLRFYESFLSLPFVPATPTESFFVVGDFNMDLYAIQNHCPIPLRPWFDWLQENFINCFTEWIPTFKRGSSRTCIDYIYGHRSLKSRMSSALNSFLPTIWTDHSLLTCDLRPSRDDIGPGAWRFNPSLLMDESFESLLRYTVHTFFETIQSQPSSVQHQWESFKVLLKRTAQTYSAGHKARIKKTLADLQRKRNNLLSTIQRPISRTALQEVEAVEKLIDTQTQRDTYQCMLRSATRWYEKGEKNNSYFFRVIRERQTQQTTEALRCSLTGTILHRTSDILQETHSFYQNLYTPDAIDGEAIAALLESIPTEAKLTSSQATALALDPSDSDLIDLIQHSPKGKSPGLDGIPFEVYKYLSEISIPFRQLLLNVIKGAFMGIFPISWQQTRMVLLFKKGDPLLLSNWRPLSLINTDAKLFTKLLANRLNRYLPQMINPYQTGFLPHRLISDNGWLNQTLMSNLRHAAPELPQVAVFLDQEKAYDRVHPDYLRQVLLHFGFPESLVSSLSLLFFETRISVSVNGWLSAPVMQLRGLRQGDPLSPLLFNLAFEPLLRTILSSPTLQGVSMAPMLLRPSDRPSWPAHNSGVPIVDNTSPQPIKLLSYAVDLEVFLTHPSEWPFLLELLTIYGRASNAKVNLNKTVLMSLSGIGHASWKTIATQQGILWHDKSNLTPIRYLGYPLYHTQDQLDSFLQDLLLKIRCKSNILRERSLSVRGSSMVANALILSRTWHLLRVVPVPSKWLVEVRSIVRRFVAPFWPAPSFDTMCLPRKHGGLGLINPFDQQLALHAIYIQRLLKTPSKYDFLTPWLKHYIQMYTGHSSPLPFLIFPSFYQSLVKKLPTLNTLCALLKKLPKLIPNPTWSSRWFLDLPLSGCLLPHTPVSSRTSSVITSSLPLRYTLSDIVQWISSSDQLTLRTTTSTRARAIIRELFPFSGPADATIRFDWYIKMPSDLLSNSPTDTIHMELWPPPFSHWCCRPVPHKHVAVAAISPGELRRLWHPVLAGTRRLLRPPYRVAPGLRLPASSWKYFWSFDIPSPMITPWWRLLHDSLPVASTLFRRNVASCPSPICRICTDAMEDTFHFVVGCPLKWQFWSSVLSLSCLANEFPDPLSVWSALTLSSSSDGHAIVSMDHGRFLGLFFLSLWKFHWRCVLNNTTWSLSGAMHFFQQDSKLLFESSLITEF